MSASDRRLAPLCIGELEALEARDILADLRRLPLRVVRMSSTIESALALAIYQGASFVTADQKLCDSFASTEIADHITWIKDIP
jgi:predicted nucleic acid-binding protein